MEIIQRNYQGFTLILNLNWDRIIVIGVIMLAFYAGAFAAGH